MKMFIDFHTLTPPYANSQDAQLSKRKRDLAANDFPKRLFRSRKSSFRVLRILILRSFDFSNSTFPAIASCDLAVCPLTYPTA
jgi:hypothetical protein